MGPGPPWPAQMRTDAADTAGVLGPGQQGGTGARGWAMCPQGWCGKGSQRGRHTENGSQGRPVLTLPGGRQLAALFSYHQGHRTTVPSLGDLPPRQAQGPSGTLLVFTKSLPTGSRPSPPGWHAVRGAPCARQLSPPPARALPRRVWSLSVIGRWLDSRPSSPGW